MTPAKCYYENIYTSSACNATPHCVDWSDNGLIAYGASNNVILYKHNDDGGGSVIRTLIGHKERVNTVRWVRNPEKISVTETVVISGSSDKSIIIWTIDKKGECLKKTVLEGHSNIVTVVDAVYRSSDLDKKELSIFSSSVDSTIKIWKVSRNKNEDEIHLNSIDIPSNGLCLSAAITTFNHGSDILVACGLDNCKISLYSESGDDIEELGKLKGHDDWVRALDFTQNGDDVLLVSASQDTTVRIWRFSPSSNAVIDPEDQITQKKQVIELGKRPLDVTLEAVLSGHEGWVYGIAWHPTAIENGTIKQPMQLLTASLDKTLIVWAPDKDSGVWLETSRMGEMGGNGLGFYGACYSPHGNFLLVHGFQGGIHLWKRKEELWEPEISITGHFSGVVDLTWEAVHGRYLLSVSLDQTTRLHAPWKTKKTWHEMGRPQIHGHDMACIAALPEFQFVSGAEEKVIRAFKAPNNFLQNFEQLCLTSSSYQLVSNLQETALGAAIPALGLSNRAVYSAEEKDNSEDKLSREQYSEVYFVPQDLKVPPTEDNLSQNTLWPEVMKLYGHGYELYSLATSNDGKLVASACKATSEEHASILLWDTKKWQKIQKLTCHQLTVTQMAFSPDDSLLLAVSRDRSWSLHNRSGEMQYDLLHKSDKKTGLHQRIIWCCAWTHDSLYFATGSRDGKVVLWSASSHKHASVIDLPKESITALAFAPAHAPASNQYLAAVGCESGEIGLYTFTVNQTEASWKLFFTIDKNSSHSLSIKRLAFRPKMGRTENEDSESKEKGVFQLASCGLDHLVRVYNIFTEVE
ncbi:probable elongator complex protein 2 [Nilaparvata lugens]|uniref:probable elongator complex protein 2 n=1 Tax=Nilaparvata lugens TaxID=108931 RepID=UPI00193CFF2E|nr:probable elongator complex protein 2 [Nilaparvata lugens]